MKIAVMGSGGVGGFFGVRAPRYDAAHALVVGLTLNYGHHPLLGGQARDHGLDVSALAGSAPAGRSCRRRCSISRGWGSWPSRATSSSLPATWAPPR